MLKHHPCTSSDRKPRSEGAEASLDEAAAGLLTYRSNNVIPLEKEVKRGTMALPVYIVAMDMMMTWPGSALACAETGRLQHPAR